MSRTASSDERVGAALCELELPPLPVGFYSELRNRLEAPPARPARRRWPLAAALAGATAVGAIVVLALAGGTPLAPRDALAAQVRSRVAEAYGRARTLRARLVTTVVGPRGQVTRIRGSVTLAADGSYRWSELVPTAPGLAAERNVSSFDATTGLSRSFSAGGEFPRPTGDEYRGSAAGPPDGGAEGRFAGQLRGVVRSLAQARQLDVRLVTVGGRRAWRVTLPLNPFVAGNPGGVRPSLAPDRLVALIDVATGFPLRIVDWRSGRPVTITRVLSLRVDERLAPGTFRLRYPGGTELRRSDDAGFRRVRLASAERIVGYRPLIPGWLPDGFRLAQVAVAREAAGTAMGLNPVSRGVVALVYRRGFEQLTVTMRLRTGSGWRDPFASAWLRFRARRVLLQRGAFAAAPAQLVLDPQTIPHVWVLGERLVLTVAGDAGPSALVRVASSLHPR